MPTVLVAPSATLELTALSGPTPLADVTERRPLHDRPDTGSRTEPGCGAGRPRLLLVTSGSHASAGKRASRYERFTTRIIALCSAIVLSITASLHFFNYGLETKTSSTSGTHSDFYTGQSGSEGE